MERAFVAVDAGEEIIVAGGVVGVSGAKERRKDRAGKNVACGWRRRFDQESRSDFWDFARTGDWIDSGGNPHLLEHLGQAKDVGAGPEAS